MARGERNARFDDRRPFIDPWFASSPAGTSVFAGQMPGYSQPDAIDPTGYSLRDLELPGRLADGMIPDDVTAPLGPPRVIGTPPPGAIGTPGDALLVGTLAPSSYGQVHGPVPGGALADESRVYGPALGGVPGSFARPGEVARKEDLGMRPTGLGPRSNGEYVGPHHAQGAAPLEYQGSGVSPEHLQSTIETGIDVYGGYQGILNPGLRGGRGAYGAIYDGRGDRDFAPMERSGSGGDFGPAALSAQGRPLFREVDPGDEYDQGVDPDEESGWRRPRRAAGSVYELGYVPPAAFEGNR
jgi:hypothetical protein